MAGDVFPVPNGSAETEMTVRDVFAANLVQGAMYGSADAGMVLLHPDVEAQRAYRFADAMLRARAMPEIPPLGGENDYAVFQRQVYEVVRSMSEQAKSLKNLPHHAQVPNGAVRIARAVGFLCSRILWACAHHMHTDKLPGKLEDIAADVDTWFRRNYPEALAGEGGGPIARALADVFGIDPANINVQDFRKPNRPGDDTGRRN